MTEFQTVGAIAKLDDEQRVVWGWASVYQKAGEPVIDAQGDTISEREIVKAAHSFVADSESGEKVVFRFDSDPLGTNYSLSADSKLPFLLKP